MSAKGGCHPDDAILGGLEEVLEDLLRQRALIAHDHREMRGASRQNCLLNGEYFARHAAREDKWWE